eukprot:gene27353-13127_t
MLLFSIALVGRTTSSAAGDWTMSHAYPAHYVSAKLGPSEKEYRTKTNLFPVLRQIVLDGKLDDEAWASVEWDETNFYVGAQLHEPL